MRKWCSNKALAIFILINCTNLIMPQSSVTQRTGGQNWPCSGCTLSSITATPSDNPVMQHKQQFEKMQCAGFICLSEGT